MKTFAIMVIWFGAGQYAQFDVERFNSMDECEVAKQAVLHAIDARWSITKVMDEDIQCVEASRPELRQLETGK